MFDPTTSAPAVALLEGALRHLCSELDPDAVPLPDASPLWSSFDAIERLAAGAKCRLARRVEESNAWRRSDHRSAEDWMASKSGTTTGRARAGLTTSKRLAALPGTDRAVADGELSDQKAEAVADGATADPESEQSLLRTARRQGVREVRDECARVKARAEDEKARQARLHRQRSLRTFKGTDGSWNLSLRNTPEVGAEIEAALAGVTDCIFNEARIAGRHEAHEAYRADAMTELVRLGAEPTAEPAASTARRPTGATASSALPEAGSGSRPTAPTHPAAPTATAMWQQPRSSTYRYR